MCVVYGLLSGQSDSVLLLLFVVSVFSRQHPEGDTSSNLHHGNLFGGSIAALA